MEQVRARDGATIVLHSTGVGPGIVVVHGGGTTIDVYRRLARALADRFTVHLYNRRGRADAPPRSVPYTADQEVDDLAAVLEHTGSGNVIGHSGGGFLALEAALRLPIDRLALYDAAVSVDGSFPSAWLPSARAAAEAGDTAKSLAITTAGINSHMAAGKLPLGVRVAIIRAFLRTPIGRTMGELLPTTLDEAALILAHDGPATRWAEVSAEVLLACGADGPPYYVDQNAALAGALPRARTLTVPRSGHDAINRAHPRIVDPLAEFFGAPVTPERARH
ncbi:alpha/beta fold hydrolase [Micromonospora taraxaci]